MIVFFFGKDIDKAIKSKIDLEEFYSWIDTVNF